MAPAPPQQQGEVCPLPAGGPGVPPGAGRDARPTGPLRPHRADLKGGVSRKLRAMMVLVTHQPPELPMHTTVAELASTLQTVFTTDAEQAARDAGLIRRVRQCSGATFVQTVVFGWLDNPNATHEDL